MGHHRLGQRQHQGKSGPLWLALRRPVEHDIVLPCRRPVPPQMAVDDEACTSGPHRRVSAGHPNAMAPEVYPAFPFERTVKQRWRASDRTIATLATSVGVTTLDPAFEDIADVVVPAVRESDIEECVEGLIGNLRVVSGP